jgi:hypothetical protein
VLIMPLHTLIRSMQGEDDFMAKYGEGHVTKN